MLASRGVECAITLDGRQLHADSTSGRCLRDVPVRRLACERRIAFATALAAGKLPLLSPPPETLQAQPVADLENEPVDPARLDGILGPTLTVQTREMLEETPDGLRAAVILGSPDFMRH